MRPFYFSSVDPLIFMTFCHKGKHIKVLYSELDNEVYLEPDLTKQCDGSCKFNDVLPSIKKEIEKVCKKFLYSVGGPIVTITPEAEPLLSREFLNARVEHKYYSKRSSEGKCYRLEDGSLLCLDWYKRGAVTGYHELKVSVPYLFDNLKHVMAEHGDRIKELICSSST